MSEDERLTREAELKAQEEFLKEREGPLDDFVAKLDQHLVEHGFEDVRMFETATRKEDYQGWTECLLMDLDRFGSRLLHRSKVDDSYKQIAKEFFDTFAEAVVETERGVALHQGAIVTAVARKPMDDKTQQPTTMLKEEDTESRKRKRSPDSSKEKPLAR
ncbi:hypothetical protein ONZ43_g6426 [Nemania bipapillata]|uniref:Uncharacterized protein n=1 Tax=Nemania bipapillata TaxID=110536 RepID=A0ACC2I0B3_9PEZI|nr:hypothetical protein ONZ43_g6426 [Nemania bipapillata]